MIGTDKHKTKDTYLYSGSDLQIINRSQGQNSKDRGKNRVTGKKIPTSEV